MKILIFSDSHGELAHMRQAIQRENPDYLFHLGDHDLDAADLAEEFPTLPMVAVQGNCDTWCSDSPVTRVVPIGGLRLFLCHGHTYGVKSSLLRASYAAREENADILLFGHTHEAYRETAPTGLVLFNPGACGFNFNPTYGCLTVSEDGGYRLEIKKC